MCTFCDRWRNDPIPILDTSFGIDENFVESSSNGKILRSTNYKNSINISFSFDKHRMELIVSDNEKTYLNEKIKINYCPMCGEKL